MNNHDNANPSEVIGQHVQELLNHLDHLEADPIVLDNVKNSLRQLNDLKVALDESSIVAVTDLKGRIVYVNDKFCEISKYTREELIGKDHRIINSGYHDKNFMRNLWETIKSGSVWHGEIRNKAKDGNYYWVDTTIVPLFDEAGQPIHFLAIRHEITRLKAVEEELKRMMVKVMDIQEEERKRFSRELHDGIGQSLFSLLISMDRLLISEEGEPNRSTTLEELSAIRQEVSHIIEDVRGLAWQLRPSILDDLGVVPAIRTYFEKFTDHYGIKVDFKSDLTKRLNHQQETVIYRIIQEALLNIGKYADVDEAEVRIKQSEKSIEVCIADKGVGIDFDKERHGVGLFSMEERAHGIGAKLNIETKPGEGTIIRLIMPV
ncbi:PAS domain-containing sensor histidine kinase [Paenibacillus dakarensis]|uniref:PAS domain-containing sensor histidine kinase n=1 Tax=Paenibacillus dakarensis TaxID=1527293 RepID=UPI0006D5A609|nr:PAS domain-containing protein [Paenibacillus dakarensis]